MLWALIGVLTFAVVAALVLPLWRPGSQAARATFDLAVYDDQLKELEAEIAAGAIGGEEGAAARLELERRILRAGAGANEGAEEKATSSERGRWITVIAVVVLLPWGVVGLYVALGSPGLPDAPLGGRADTTEVRQGAPGGGMTTAIARLAERMKSRPDDVEGWRLLARSYAQVNRFDDAASAYRRALALAPGDGELLNGQGEVLVLAAQGVVTPAARASFEAVLDQEPQSVAARYYLGLAEAQAGHPEAAYERWLALLQSAPPGAPWFGEVRKGVEDLAAQLGKEMPGIAPPRAASGPRAGPGAGPSAEDVAAAADMSAEDREAMIAAMVARLAARLEHTPGDVEGWLRLGRAYEVMGRAADAAAAYGRALALLPDGDPRREELARRGLQD